MDPDFPLRLSALQGEILEAIATGKPFKSVADSLCKGVEALAPDVICSILRVDADGYIHPVAAPSLPVEYSTALESLKIGPEVGSCGTAAYLGEPVLVEDIETDPKWGKFKDGALRLGLRACWSSPIKGSDGRVIATFAFYFSEKRGPSALETTLVDACVHLCAVALEHEETAVRNYQLAYYDQLTKLPNRYYFERDLEIGFSNGEIGLLLVDIDNFKLVNDTMGHQAGDMLIRAIGAGLKEIDTGIVPYRIGGDEFAVICDACTSADVLAAAANSVLEAVAAPFEWHGRSIIPGVTIGGVVAGQDGSDTSQLRKNADIALYHAKETMRGGYLKFSNELRTSITKRIEETRQLDSALSEDRVLAYYQPIICMQTGKVMGLEALARIRRLDGSIVTAQEFHSAFDDPKNATRLTNRILRQITVDIKKWLSYGIDFGRVSLNLTTEDFRRPDLGKRLSDAFSAAGVPLKHLQVEVTETVMMDDRINDIVEELRAMGVKAALDDFGTGYASLKHLMDFPVDTIKIDKSFVDRVLTERCGRAIVEALVGIAKKMNIDIVAEGIETPQQAEHLAEMGCSFGQGYLFSRPANFVTITQFMDVMRPKKRRDIQREVTVVPRNIA